MTEERSLTAQIAQLSPDQALQAMLNLYELLPDELWIDDAKWPLSDMEIQAELLQDRSPEGIQPLLGQLIGPGNEPLKAEMAKALLLELASADSAVSYVGAAVAAAQQPDMLPIPLLIGAVIVLLAIIPTKIKTEKFEMEFGNVEQVAKITGNIAEIAKRFDLARFIK